MLFNSLNFLIFFIIVYTLYILLNHRWQNKMLLVASYVFYGFWDWRFLSLIIISTIVDYFCGIRIFETNNQTERKKFLFFSVFVNLAFLGFFKYFNFFSSNLVEFLNMLGVSVEPRTLNVILPVGISFYTFQTMSYTIDIYRKQLSPTKKFFDFALFVAFFPQLVAGPIERAKRLLPQMLAPRTLTVSKFTEGCFLIFWGLFEKIFIAGNLAKIVDPIFINSSTYEGGLVYVGLCCFAFQIFCDFDAYSNIARGLGKCMGFELMINFNLPYFAKNPSEFWKRWHISLSTWLRDYLYIPLGGNRKSKGITYRNLTLTMLLGGLWHGASWTFIVWGFYHGILLMGHRLALNIKRNNSSFEKVQMESESKDKWFLLKVFVFFQFTLLGWLLFRAESLTQITQMMHAIVFNIHLNKATIFLFGKFFLIVSPLLIAHSFQYKHNDLLFIYRQHWFIQTAIYAFMAYLILGWGIMTAEEFIYFQF